MLIAVDQNNNRILPKKGRLGFCQICRQPVRAYCGDIYIDHWQHIKKDCDSWSEVETEWHLGWKSEFPEDWQEVIINKNSEKHIADILTPDNLVLELQNSSISSTTIKIRESFYGKMIWLLNANKFKDNFSIYSLVKSRLREIEDNYFNFIIYDPKESDELIEEKEKLDEIKVELREVKYNITKFENQINEVQELVKNLGDTAEIVNTSKYYYSDILRSFRAPAQDRLKELNEKILQLANELEKQCKIRTAINELESSKIREYEHYKYVRPVDVSSSSFSKCALVEKESEKSLFPTIIHFKSENEFKNISKNKNYRLIIDPTFKLEETNSKIKQIEEKIKDHKNKRTTFENQIKFQLKTFLNQEKLKFNEKIDLAKKNKTKLDKEFRLIENSISSIKERDSKKCADEASSINTSHEQQKFEIMKKYKGLYSYNWKYKRKTWDFSEKKIFLDFDNEIFEILSSNTMRKYKKSEFIDKVKSWR